jgi:hypothetical protein
MHVTATSITPAAPSYDERADFASKLTHEAGRKALVQFKELYKHYYVQKENAITLRKGDLVLQLQHHARRGRSPKRSSPWIAPYSAVEVTGVNCVLLSGTKQRNFKVHSNGLKLFV